MKLVLIGKPSCKACTVMKNQIMDRIDELTEIGASFEYINLDERLDKDTFIEKFKLTALPTSWVEVDGFMSESFSGYVDIDTLFSFVEDTKNG